MEGLVKLGKIRMIDLDRRYGIITEEEDPLAQMFKSADSGGNIVFQLDDETAQLKEGQLVQFVKAEGKATHVVPLLDPSQYK